MSEKMPAFSERLVMHLEGRLDWEHPFNQFYRLDEERKPEPIDDPEHLYMMMAAQADESFRPRKQVNNSEFSRRVLGGPTQLSILINSAEGDPAIQEELLAVIESVRRSGGRAFAYGGKHIHGPVAHAFLTVPRVRRFFSPSSHLKLGLPEDAASLDGDLSCASLVTGIRRLVLRAAATGHYEQVDKRLNDVFGEDNLLAKPGDSVEFSAFWMKRYEMAKEAKRKNLRQLFLDSTGVPPEFLYKNQLGRFFEENI